MGAKSDKIKMIAYAKIFLHFGIHVTVRKVEKSTKRKRPTVRAYYQDFARTHNVMNLQNYAGGHNGFFDHHLDLVA